MRQIQVVSWSQIARPIQKQIFVILDDYLCESSELHELVVPIDAASTT
jgi:hypothetical protein